MTVIFMDFKQNLCDHMPEKSDPHCSPWKEEFTGLLHITEFTDVPAGCKGSVSEILIF